MNCILPLPLVIGTAERARAAEVMAYALARPWHPKNEVPSDQSPYEAAFGPYCTTFICTDIDGQLYRHLSVRLEDGSNPHPFSVFAIAEAFGFTGWSVGAASDALWGRPPKDWIIDFNPDDGTALVAQVMPA